MKIAQLPIRSADNGIRRKAPLFCLTLLMLVFYIIHRTGKNPDKKRLFILEQAKNIAYIKERSADQTFRGGLK
jgi:hypothetical protein